MLGTYATVALQVAIKARQIEYQLVAIGVMAVMVGQSLLNIAVATGAMPTTGLPFPLFSYGGSSMIASLALSGLLIRVAREENTAQILTLPRVPQPEVENGLRPSLGRLRRGNRSNHHRD